MASEAAAEPAAVLTKGKCDLCTKPDGYGGHNLQKCKECGLLVHELCYATVPTECKNPNFTCHACKAVGTEVEVNVPSRVGGCKKTGIHREMMKQEIRSKECALCSVKSGVHAMHPLFDMPGPEGRQLVLPATGAGFQRKERRLAWVHTLCAQYICTATGFIYGLFEGGEWEGQEDDMEKSQQKKDEEQHREESHVQKYEIGTEVSKEFEAGWFDGKVTEYRYDEDEGEYLYNVLYEDGDREDYNEQELEEILISRKERHSSLFATESFCFLTGVDKKTGIDADKTIKELRELKCTICNSNDNHSLRLPVQCMAYDPNEFKEFKKCHKSIKGVTKPECTLAIHVGCARWATKNFAGVKGRSLRMCYFYPGQCAGYKGEEVYKDAVCDAFCRVHAREVMEHMKDAVKRSNEESEDEPESPQAKTAKMIAAKKRKNAFLEDIDEDD